MSPLTIFDVNNITEDEFVRVFGNVIELFKEAAIEIEKIRPFSNVGELRNSFQKYLDKLDIESKVEVLKLHPDLAGKLAASGALTEESTNEQRSAGLDQITEEQKKHINDFNERYKEKFGFPFIICARENKVPAIIDGFQSRYHNSRIEEIATAIGEVKKICKLRILDIVKS